MKFTIRKNSKNNRFFVHIEIIIDFYAITISLRLNSHLNYLCNYLTMNTEIKFIHFTFNSFRIYMNYGKKHFY